MLKRLVHSDISSKFKFSNFYLYLNQDFSVERKLSLLLIFIGIFQPCAFNYEKITAFMD